MKMLMYSIKDNVSGKFDQPYLAYNEQDVERAIQWLLQKSEQFSVNAHDYSVYKVGAFELENGDIIPELSFLFNVVDLVKVGE